MTNPYIALCRELDIVPKVDVLAGSSAGGLNAAFLGAAIVHGCPNLDPIRQLWLDHGSFDRLLRRPTDPSLISVLNGDENFLPSHRGLRSRSSPRTAPGSSTSIHRSPSARRRRRSAAR